MFIDTFDDPSTPTILVIEDERLLRTLAIDVLSETGLVPCEASNADETLSMLATYPSIAVVLMRWQTLRPDNASEGTRRQRSGTGVRAARA
jgi:CheY-like chemotaxis protein